MANRVAVKMGGGSEGANFRWSPQLLARVDTTGSTFASYTTAKTVIDPSGLVDIPADFLKVGHMLRVKTLLGISNVVTAQPTFTFQVMVGAVAAFTTGALTSVATANTLVPMDLEIDLRVDSIGSGTSAKLIGLAKYQSAAFGTGQLVAPTTTPAVGTGFDSTVGNTLDFYAAIQTSNAGNAVKVYNYTVELLNP